jgi:DNA-binding CsgD family transcriptional regulator
MREANITISDTDYETMGVEELVSLCGEAGLLDVEELECTGNGGLIQVELESRVDEQRLDALEYVYQWEFVGEVEDAYLYLIGFVAPELPEDVTEHSEDLVGTCDPEVSEHGVTMSLVGPPEAIRDMIREYVDAGVNPDLRSLGEYDGSEGPLADLTGRQREVLEAAYAAGYYEVPRDASTEDVATELGVDPSTVAEHLQRAERNLLIRHLQAG